jgi:hypothetical protein
MTEMTKGTKQYLKEVFGMDNIESMPVSMFKTLAENIQDGKDCGYSTQADEELQELLFEYVTQHTPARMRMPDWLSIHVINRLLELTGAYSSSSSDFYAKMHGKYCGQLFRFREEYER